MQRVLRAVVGLLTIMAVVTVVPVAAEEILSPPGCGFKLRHPGWTANRPKQQDGTYLYALRNGKRPPTIVWIGPVWEIPPGKPSAESRVLASVGQLCLACAEQHPLVWTDRFTDGSRTVSYAILSADFQFTDDPETFKDGYSITFFIADKNVPGTQEGALVRTDVSIWVSRSEYHENERLFKQMVRQLELSKPDPTCWR